MGISFKPAGILCASFLCSFSYVACTHVIKMNSKMNIPTISGSAKKKRKVIGLEDKLTIIAKYEAGSTKANLSREHNISESTVRHILRHAKQYKDRRRSAFYTPGLQMTRNRSNIMIQMERLLCIWIEDCNKNGITLSPMTIKSKALNLFKTLKVKLDQEGNEKEQNMKETFCASSGWFDRFKKRASDTHNIIVCESATSTVKTADAIYQTEIKKFIKENGYTEKQIFNVGEAGLFWKKMPNKTYLAKTEKCKPGFKVGEDRLTLLLAVNASGDLKLKPMVVYQSQSPLAPMIMGYDNHHALPVYWRANKTACVTKSLFEEWFMDCFSPEVEKYCKLNDIDFKILLLLDDGPSHTTALNDLCPNIKIMFLPPNTASLLQPMDHQGVIDTFKAYYLRKIFTQAIEINEDMTLTQFWKQFNLKHALENIKEAWHEVTSSEMRAAWRNIIPHCVNAFQGFEAEINDTVEHITRLGIYLGLSELDAGSVQELLQYNGDDLNDENHNNLEEEHTYDKQNSGDEDEEIETATKEGITVEGFHEIFHHCEHLKQLILHSDPNVDRAMKVRREIENAISCYRIIYQKMEKSSI